MKRYSLVHLSDDALLHGLATLVARDRGTTAELLAHIAEVDARKLYRPAAYPSMFAYCVGELHLSEDAAAKRIQVARAARRFPEIFAAVADGRLHLTGLNLLAAHLTEETAQELLEAATHKTKAEIELLLARRFPRPDLPPLVQPIPMPASAAAQHAPAHVANSEQPAPEHAPAHVEVAPESFQAPAPACERARVKPLAPQRFALQCTIDQETHDALRYAQELLGHELPSGDVAQVLSLALRALIPQLEKRRFSATTRPRPRPGRQPENPRYIPAHVQRAVWQRDQGKCSFVSDDGHRCQERKFVELDHVQEVARGGEATVANLRLRCRAHNQYEAERTFGAEFMRHKRLAASEARAGAMATRHGAARILWP